MVVLDVTEATTLRDAPLLKGADSLLLQLSVCLCISAVQRLTSLGISIWVLALEPADQMSGV
jgi:hypothetical protein